MDPKIFNPVDGKTAVNAKLDNLFRVDTNQATLMAYESFKSYARPEGTLINDYLIEFNHLFTKLKKFKICLPESVLAY